MLYVLYALIAGAVSAFAFEPLGWWPLFPIAIAVLCELTCRSKTLWRGLLVGWAFGFGLFVVSLNWIATAFTFQAAMPPWLGWVAVVLLSLYLAIYPALAAGLAWRFGREDRVVLVLVLGGAWAITEWLRGSMFTGFPWNPAAAVLAPTPLIGISALIGTYGLSGLVVLLGGAIWLEYYKKWLPLVIILGTTILLWLLPSSPVPDDPLTIRNVRIVQPKIGQQDKWRPGFDDEAARRLATLSGPPSGEPRLLLWPEAAITDPVEDARTDEHQAMALFQRSRAASLLGPGDRLLTGGIAVASRDGIHVDGAANSIYILGPGGKIEGRYDKAHLVPFGEYLPMRPLLSAIGLSRLAPGDIDFTAGPGPRSIDLGGEWGKVGFQLCYEIIFSGHVVDEKNRPGLHLQPVERRLVRQLGAAAAPRPGAAARRRRGHPCAAGDADRHQRRHRRARPNREFAAMAQARRDRRGASAGREFGDDVCPRRQCDPADPGLPADVRRHCAWPPPPLEGAI